MSKVELIDKRFLWNQPCAVYSIGTAKAGTVYMRVTRSNYNNDQRAVVIVDAEKLLAAWRAFPFFKEPVSLMDEQGWRQDYKFESAADGFSHGIENPVPLADIGVHPPKGKGGVTSVAFTNGITRTIWLLANGASAFPIECRASDAAALHAAAGIQESPVHTVDELLGHMNLASHLSRESSSVELGI